MEKEIIWTNEEDDYIEKYFLVKSDEEIAKELNKTKCQIQTHRIKLGFKKQRQTLNKEKKEGMKWCWYCSDFHVLELFSKNKNKPDGLQDECKLAVKELVLKRKLKKNKIKNNIEFKVCCSCNIEQHINNFIKNVSTIDGYSNICKECLNNNEKLIRKFKIKGE